MAAMSAILFAVICLLLLNEVPLCDTSHFRGGTISWKPNYASPFKVDFRFRLAFRRSLYSAYFCNSSTVNLQGIIGSGSSWIAESQGNSYSIADTGFHCTSYSALEDWSSGENKFNYIFPHAGPWVVRYYTCCWISLVSGGGSWSLSTTFNLARRRDTGKINSSPVSASSPLFRLQSGCSQVIKIPVGDPDGDVVRCRWANGSTECGGMCNSFTYADLDESSCTLRYHGYGGLGFYGVAITLEDFPYGTNDFKNTRPFSQVGLQFLVQIVSNGGPCNRIPFFAGSTPSDGTCMEIAIESTYRASLVAQHMDSSRRIVEISTVSPLGMNLTSLRSYYNQLSELCYVRDVTWSPTSADAGQHIFCFKAIDQTGAESKSRCITFLVGTNSTPEVILGTRSPTYPTVMRGPGYVDWKISFSHLMKKPTNSKFIRFHLNDKEIYKLDTSSSDNISISDNNTVLHFRTPYPVLSMPGRYFVTMDTGAVVGFGCSIDGPPTPGIHDSTAWNFYNGGVCPSGYYLGPDLYTCIDVDECYSPSVRRKRSSTDDLDDDGSYRFISRQRRSAAPECRTYTMLNDANRKMSYEYRSVVLCDRNMVQKWYRFSAAAGEFMPESCVPEWRCGTHAPGWLNGKHPTVADGAVTRQVCYHWVGNCCNWKNNITIRNCGGFYVYELENTPVCALRYCGGGRAVSTVPPTTAAPQGCPSSLVGYSGNFSTPNFPRNYNDYESCSWGITTPIGYRVKVEFHTFYIEGGYDYLKIYDGPSSSSALVAQISGYHLPCVFHSSGRSLWFYFYTDGSVTMQGFHATYTAVSRSDAYHSLNSGSSPVAWNVHAVTSVPSLPWSSQCIPFTTSKVLVYTSTDIRLSSSDIQPSMTNYVSSATASANQGSCSRSLSGYSGSLFTPNYPNSYPHFQNCLWTISVPYGYRVSLEFRSFSLEGGKGCLHDFVEIRDGYSADDRVLGKYCGKIELPRVVSSGTYMRVQFRSDKSYSYQGFDAHFTAISGAPTASNPAIQATHTSKLPNVRSTRVPTPTPASGPFVLRLPANCEHSCDNYYGSYACTCRSGYARNSDNRTCHEIDECAQNNGGCSHSCVNFIGGHYCACLEGQTMLSDNRTCVEPGISVECEDEYMQITLERKYFAHLQMGRFHLRYRNCQATGLNQTHMTFYTQVNDCGTTHNETTDELSYWNEVQVDYVAIGGVISRMHEVSIPFYCVYSKKKLISGASYKPRRVVFAPEAGYGNMTFTIDLYTSSSYLQPYWSKDYPIRVELNTDLYVGYNVLSNKGRLEVFAESCWATPQTSPYSTPYYTFMRSGCLLDMSMSAGNISSSSKYFTIKAFRFFNFLDGYNTVYQHCELMACHVHTANSRCSRGCERFRRKKRVASDFESPESESSKKYALSLGPISKQQQEGGSVKEENNEGSSVSDVALIGGTVVAVVLGLAIVIAVAVIAAKYGLVRRVENRNKVGDMCMEEKVGKNNYAVEHHVDDGGQAKVEC